MRLTRGRGVSGFGPRSLLDIVLDSDSRQGAIEAVRCTPECPILGAIASDDKEYPEAGHTFLNGHNKTCSYNAGVSSDYDHARPTNAWRHRGALPPSRR